jgi:3-hydroxyisobutyrate dehydrogenase-like beta-hydroxyacid dehydrogenase
MLGGDEAAAERCRAVFETYGDPVIFVGPLGAAMAVKLVNNAMMAAHLALAADALDLGLRLGIPPGTTGRCLGHGSGASFSLQVLTMVGDLGNMANAGPLLRKDLTILTELAEAAGAPMGLLEPLADEALARMGIARRDQTPSG